MKGMKNIYENQKTKKNKEEKKIIFKGEELHHPTVVRELLFVIC